MRHLEINTHLTGHLGEQILKARSEKGMSAKCLADSIGVRQQTVTRWENGDREPSYEYVCRLSEVLGKPLSYFYDPCYEEDVEFNKYLERVFDYLSVRAEFDEHARKLLKRAKTGDRPVPRPRNFGITYPSGREQWNSNDHLLSDLGETFIPAPAPKIPVVGSIAAGEGVSNDDFQGQLLLASHNWKSTYHAVRVTSDSMHPVIQIGDVVVIDSALEPVDGDIVAARGYGEDKTVLKYFHLRGRKNIILSSANTAYPPEVYQAVHIVGVCIDLIRHFKDPKGRWF